VPAAPRPWRPDGPALSFPAEYAYAIPETAAHEEGHNVEIVIASIGIMVALILILTVMGRRERPMRDLIALEESGILDVRRHNDASGSR
jgi:hypothetical protein